VSRVLSFRAMRAWRVVVLCAAIALGAPLLGTRDAQASVSVAVTFDALVRDSSAVVVGTATEQRSVWEGARIYTYSHLHVDSSVAGELGPGDEVWVRTMGGVAGKVGQIVDGEAVLTVGRPSLVFLHRSSETSDTYVVTARAQGQFGLYADDQKQLRVRRSSGVGTLLPPQGTTATSALAGDVIHGRAVADAAKDIATAWSRAHAP
jgi:hypothetical protein